jgi:hypothetical protein
MNQQPREFKNDVILRFYARNFTRDDGTTVTTYTFIDAEGYKYELKYNGDKKQAMLASGDPGASKVADFLLLKSKAPVTRTNGQAPRQEAPRQNVGMFPQAPQPVYHQPQPTQYANQSNGTGFPPATGYGNNGSF